MVKTVLNDIETAKLKISCFIIDKNNWAYKIKGYETFALVQEMVNNMFATLAQNNISTFNPYNI